jgi:tRNA pseudouridine38-40 synthase
MPFVLHPGFSRYLCGVQYIGTHFNGWQTNAIELLKPTVQTTIANSIIQFIGPKHEVKYLNFRGSSRTDAGVNAFRNTFQIDLPKQYKTNDICNGINFYLQSNHVSILDATLMSSMFDVREHTMYRTYMYRICYKSNATTTTSTYPMSHKNLFQKDYSWSIPHHLNIGAMRQASEYLIGWKDFSTFRNTHCQATTPWRNLFDISITEECINSSLRPHFVLDDYRLIVITVSANAFLLRMVRNIVGVLVHVGLEKMKVDEVKAVLEAKDRYAIHRIRPAPPEGLFLLNVEHHMQSAVTQ